MKKLLLITLLFILNSCATNYYFVIIEEDAAIYTSKKGTDSIAVIPKGFGAYINRSDKKQRKVKWKKFHGWIINPVYSNASISKNSNNNNSPNRSYIKSSTKTSAGGPVYVKGYTRKNGTYVPAHTRSAAKRR